MDCLLNRIGILGCGAPVGDDAPQLYINSLPGITLENIEALADHEQKTFVGVWEDVVLRAQKKFEIQVKAELNKCYKITDKAIVACLVCENAELFDVALWYLHGTELMIERTSTDNLNRFTTVDLEKAEKLKADFFVEYGAALKDAVDSINPLQSSCLENECVECNNSPVKFVSQIP